MSNPTPESIPVSAKEEGWSPNTGFALEPEPDIAQVDWICPACGGAVRGNMLVCRACAEHKSDDGVRRVAIARYYDDSAPLYLAVASHHHILPARGGHVLTLCGRSRYRVSIKVSAHWRVSRPANPKNIPLVEELCCPKCWQVLADQCPPQSRS